MRDFLEQINSACDARLYYVALWAALSVPDICGALEAPNGQATGPRYVRWFDSNLPDYAPEFSGKECYGFRNSLLHQGSGHHSKRAGVRLIFLEPNDRIKIHRSLWGSGDDRVFIMDIRAFAAELTTAAGRWLDDHADDGLVRRNLDRFVRRHPEGFSPVIVGTPVIG